MKKIYLFIFLFLSSYLAISQSFNLSNPEEFQKFIEFYRQNTEGLPLGSEFPQFEFRDLEGEIISSEDIKSKLIVLNTWFVGCTGCKQEEEYLRQLTSQMKDREDIVFISFAMSSKEKVEKYFSKKGHFGYRTASVNREWIEANLNITLSPTHYLIKNGVLQEIISMPIASARLMEWYMGRIIDVAK
jgi:peroxiredoxin